ncbi:MAG: cytochrome C oxidase subunit II [Gemmatimonadota bacterium]
MHTGMESPERIWWKPVPKVEKLWIKIAFGWCLILFAAMPFWHLRGGQNASGIRHTVDETAFRERVDEFIATYQVGEDRGFPIVAPPPGSDVYLQASMWSWRPILQLERGVEYTLHLSSTDVNHGFSLLPLNVNLQVVPGYDYGLRVTPNAAGDFRIICNEFCGVGHHLMIGRVIVVEPGTNPVPTTAMAEGGDV